MHYGGAGGAAFGLAGFLLLRYFHPRQRHHQIRAWKLLVVTPYIAKGDQHMLAIPTRTHPKYIWLIAAVRRDRKILSAKIHHIPAETEREARHFLLREHVCFFAGRIVRGE